jgi:hypothetical protein
MVNEHPPQGPWGEDDDDDSATFDGESMLDALDIYTPAGEFDGAEDVWDAPRQVTDTDDDQVQVPGFTATNPSGAVSVTVSLDSRILGVELSSRVVRMTEAHLAEEITVIAGLARQRARAAQHAVVAEFMGGLGNDRVMTRGFLEHDLGLPSPETVLAEESRLRATRYPDGSR